MYTILHGDVIEQLKTLDDNSVDAVIVDPPYNLNMDKWDKWPSNKEFGEWCQAWATETHRVLKPHGNILSFGCTKTYHWMACGLESAGFKTRDMIEWVYWGSMPKAQNLKSCHEPIYHGTKGRPTPLNVDDCRITAKEEFKSTIDNIILPGMPTGHHPGRKGYGGNTDAKIYGKALDDKPYAMHEGGRHPYNIITDSITELRYPANILDVKKPRGDESIKEHQTQKPISLMKWLITLTTNPGDTVLDCFGGTGTTGAAALDLGRNIILVEREEEYVKLIRERMERHIPKDTAAALCDF